jgi:hypothetical protein
MSNVLADIQAKIKAPKDKENTFGKYRYRNAEGILSAFKDVQPEGVSLVMSDEIVFLGNRLFLTATATLWQGSEIVGQACGAAMHALEKKGMDDAQITGACSSYARKYALCGLFAIDDSTDDPDSKDHRSDEKPKRQPAPPAAAKSPATNAQIADRLIQRFGEFNTVQALNDFTDPAQPAGAAWDKLGKDDPKEADRVKAAFHNRVSELEEI